jgi:DNA-binding CsgD family transcriptional regulator
MANIARSGGATIKQMAYARGLLSAAGKSKQEIALNAGYKPNAARSIASHIENKPGFNNAMAKLAQDSNNLALAALHEFKARGFSEFSNKDLVGALNAIGQAWSRFNPDFAKKHHDDPGKTNRLRTLVLNRIENQTVIEAAKEDHAIRERAVEVEQEEYNNNDF